MSSDTPSKGTQSPAAPLLCDLDSALTDHAIHALRWIVSGAGRHRCSLSVYSSAHYALDALQAQRAKWSVAHNTNCCGD